MSGHEMIVSFYYEVNLYWWTDRMLVKCCRFLSMRSESIYLNLTTGFSDLTTHQDFGIW